MNEARVQIDQNGRFLFPAKIRKKYDIKSGDIFIMRVIGDEIRIVSLDKAVEKAQNVIRKHVPQDVSLVDECLEMRRQEFALEKKSYRGKS